MQQRDAGISAERYLHKRMLIYITKKKNIHICNRDGEAGEAATCCGGITCDFRHALCDEDAVLVGKYAISSETVRSSAWLVKQ